MSVWRRRQAPSPPWRAGSRPGHEAVLVLDAAPGTAPVAGRILAIALARHAASWVVWLAAGLGAALESGR